MRVLTWNLQWRERADWAARLPGVGATLERLAPDVAALQEVWVTAETSSAALLADRLGLHAAVATPSLPPPPDPPERPDQEGVEVGVALLSRWPIAATREHLLPSGHRARIVALVATVDHPAGPLHVVVSCIDWELDLGAERLAQARALAGLLTDPALDGPLPVLLAADLNAPPSTPEIRALTGVATDAWVAAGGAEGAAGHTLSTRNPLAPRAAWQIDERIDYVLARPGSADRPVVVERAFLAGEPVDGLHPSDHFAVVADLGVGGPP